MSSVWRKLDGTYWAALVALGSIVFVMFLLFAFPSVTWALGFAFPFVVLGFFAAMFLGMNLRWKLWRGIRPVSLSISDLGFMLCFLAFAVYGFAFLSDSWTNIHYVLVGLIALSIFRVAFLEFEGWWLGIVLCVALAAVFGPHVVFTLDQPSWFFDFSAGLLLLTGVSLLFGGSVLALLESPSNSRREQWPVWLKACMSVLGVALIVTLTTSAGMTIANRQVVTPAEESGAREVVFDGGRLDMRRTAWADGPARILVVNQDLRVHTFTVEGLGIDVAIGPKSERLLEVNLTPGEYRFECRVPGHLESGAFAVE